MKEVLLFGTKAIATQAMPLRVIVPHKISRLPNLQKKKNLLALPTQQHIIFIIKIISYGSQDCFEIDGTINELILISIS